MELGGGVRFKSESFLYRKYEHGIKVRTWYIGMEVISKYEHGIKVRTWCIGMEVISLIPV